MLLFLKTFDEGHIKMAEAMSLLFNSQKSYFKINGLAQANYTVFLIKKWPFETGLGWKSFFLAEVLW